MGHTGGVLRAPPVCHAHAHIIIPSRNWRPLTALLMGPIRYARWGDAARRPKPHTEPRQLRGAVGLTPVRWRSCRPCAGMATYWHVSTAGMWALVPALRGHGDVGPTLDAGTPGDVLACLDELTAPGRAALGLRGVHMGGFLARNAAAIHGGRSGSGGRRPRSTRDAPPVCSPIRDFPCLPPRARSAARRDESIAWGVWHARGDEVVSWGDTVRLCSHAHQPTYPKVSMGGHIWSLQHDPVTHADTVNLLATHLTGTVSTGIHPPSPTAFPHAALFGRCDGVRTMRRSWPHGHHLHRLHRSLDPRTRRGPGGMVRPGPRGR